MKNKKNLLTKYFFNGRQNEFTTNIMQHMDIARSGRNGPVIKKNGNNAVKTDGISININL